MRRKEIKEILKKTGFPVAYSHFKERKTLPVITFIEQQKDSFFADDTIYAKGNAWQAELYTQLADEDLEDKVENILVGAGLPCRKAQIYIPEQDCYETIFTFEEMIDNE